MMSTYSDHDFELEISLLLEAIFRKYSYDFRQYSQASVKRRVSQALIKFQCETVSSLQDKILRDHSAFLHLLQFLTVPTSEMFRDPSYYSSIRNEVVPLLKTYASVKIWIAGCSTGEEVYSLAILLREEGLLEKCILYATDINPKSLEKAEAGVFNLDEVKKFTINYQKSGGKKSFSDYYTAAYGGALFDGTLRKQVSFSDHSLATDSVFSETQFISCRNVLIYFEKELQNRALGLFTESLCHKGFLGLGSKESLKFSSYDKAYQTISKENRIYRKE